jgi:hypothetical protein
MGIPTSLAKAKQLAVYWDNYVNYLSTLDDRQPNIGQGKPRPPQTTVYITPFGKDLAANQFLVASATAARWNTFKTAIGNKAKDTLTGADSVLNLDAVRVAKVVIKTGISTTKQIKSSSRTKRKYITYGGEAGSIPFGRNVETDDEYDVYQGLVTAIKANSAFSATTMKISRIKEKF